METPLSRILGTCDNPVHPVSPVSLVAEPAEATPTNEASRQEAASTFFHAGYDFGLLGLTDPADIFQFYQLYAYSQGFSVRTERTKYKVVNRVTTEIPINIHFVCTRYGTTHKDTDADSDAGDADTGAERPTPRRRLRTTPSKGCQGQLRIIRTVNKADKENSVEGSWKVKLFIDAHNHSFLDSEEICLTPAHRKISMAMRKRVDQLGSTGMSVPLICRILHLDYDQFVLPKDVQNQVGKRKRAALKDDEVLLMSHFIRRQRETPGFVYELDTDTDGRLLNAFWMEEEAIKKYAAFGDVIVFDTTYQLNVNRLPFVPIVGVDNHGLTTLLACAVVQSEGAESFKWVFECLLEVVKKHPATIFTDQDSEMTKAILEALPNSKQAWCIWHITRKFPEKFSRKLGGLLKAFIADFHHLMESEMCPEKMQHESWPDLLQKYDLLEDNHLANLYQDREQWMPCFLRTNFCAGLTTTQRSEGFNSLCDHYLNTRTTLLEFATQIEKVNAARKIVSTRKRMETKLRLDEGPGTLSSALAKHVFCTYTTFAYKKVLKQLNLAIGYDFLQVSTCEYLIKHHSQDQKGRLVKYFEDNKHAVCECNEFSFSGFPCRHIFRVWMFYDVHMIPTGMILDRWKIDPPKKADPIVQKQASEVSGVDRQRHIRYIFGKLANFAQEDETLYTRMITYGLGLLDEQVDTTADMAADVTTADTATEFTSTHENENLAAASANVHIRILNPTRVISMGRPKSSATMKSSIEKSMEKTQRKCGRCHELGHYQSSKKCPLFQATT